MNIYISFPSLLAFSLTPALVASLYTPFLPLLLRGELGTGWSVNQSVGQVVDQGVKQGVGRLHLVPLGKDLLKYINRCPMPTSLPGRHPSGAWRWRAERT